MLYGRPMGWWIVGRPTRQQEWWEEQRGKTAAAAVVGTYTSLTFVATLAKSETTCMVLHGR